MAAVREQFWIPKLRSLVKSVRSECYGCKRFTATPVTAPVPGTLPEDRTVVGAAFEVVGEDFAGPIRYRQNTKSERKAFLTIFTCSLSRAVHLELLPSPETGKFIACLKRFIARRGRPRVVYSDNGGTFIKTNKWLRQLRKDECHQSLLDEHEIDRSEKRLRMRLVWRFLALSSIVRSMKVYRHDGFTLVCDSKAIITFKQDGTGRSLKTVAVKGKSLAY